MSEYNLYCEFDIEKHKQNYTNYLEVIIDSDGKIMYAVPSHQEKLIAMACKKLNVNRPGLDALCPREYWGDYLNWLCQKTEAIAVWNDNYYAANINQKQINALKRLKMAGLYKGGIPY